MAKFKLKWAEEVFWEVEVEARNRSEAEKMFFDWAEEVHSCKETKTEYVEGSLELEMLK